MGKHQNPALIQLRAEGTQAERALIKKETYSAAKKLADKMPSEPASRLMYIRELTQKTLRKDEDMEVFKLFIKMTNSYMELQTCAPRAKMLERRRST